MKRIAIELNHVYRAINTQLLKYYKKGIDEDYDEFEEIIPEDVEMEKILPFKDDTQKYNFIYIDYPYEIFGCGKTVETDLTAYFNEWLEDLADEDDEDYEVLFFGINEKDLSIQSSYFFLAKTGTRCRKVIFPKDSSEIWNEADVVITVNSHVVETKPSDKKCILINKEYNKKLVSHCDLNYNSLSEIIQDKDFLNKITY